MANKNSFIIYNDWYDSIKSLSDERLGALLRAMFAFNRGEDLPELDEGVSMAYSFIESAFSRDKEKYQQMSKKRTEAINSRWEKQRKNDSDSNLNECIQNIQKNTNDTDNDNVNDSDSVSVNDSDNVNDIKNILSSTCVDTHSCIDYQYVVDVFNSICVSLPKVQKLTNKRKKKIKSMLALLNDLSVDEYFGMAESSDFLTGRNGSNWRCSFDWLIQSSNITKVIEGNYKNKTQQISVVTRNYDEEF